jgi:hypothetical protein
VVVATCERRASVLVPAYDPRSATDEQVAASVFLSLAGAAEQPDDVVIDVGDATEANLRGVSR